MITKIKEQLISNPEYIKEVLEHFDYHNIVIHPSYISFGRDAQSSKKSIVIMLQNNNNIYVTDYPLNINKEMFSYVCEQRHTDFKTVLQVVKSVMGISDYYEYFNNDKQEIFGGFYKNIKKKSEQSVKIYDKSILDNYPRISNQRFLRDNISLSAQKYFDIRYDVDSQSILIPVLDQIGQLMGIKCRVNHDIEDGEQKYWYLLPCRASLTLYGFYQNYEYLVDNDIYIVEAEKSVQQCYSYGIRNVVALGSGSISLTQAKMLMELHPRSIIFLHDVGYSIDSINKNIEVVKNYSVFNECDIGYWDWTNGDYPNKSSPSDLGKETLEYILKNEIKIVGDNKNEELQGVS